MLFMEYECIVNPVISGVPNQNQANVAYNELVNSVINSNVFYKIVLKKEELGVFVYNVVKGKIVFTNNIFLDHHQITLSNLQRPSFRRFVFSRFHYEDARMIRELEMQSTIGESNRVISKVVRIRQTDQTYKAYHFVLIIPNDQKGALNHIRVGLQINISYLSTAETKAKPDIQKYRKFLSCLSVRELEVLGLIVHGYTDKEVGEKLHISLFTAQKHRKNILKKLQIRNTAHLSFIAGKSGII